MRRGSGSGSVDLSLVVPLLDEEDNVEALVSTCLEALKHWGRPSELILVNDGSRDATGERLDDCVKRSEAVRVVHLRRRFGKGAALAAGFAEARGKLIATLDADLQEDPRELPSLRDALNGGLDLVTGWRRVRRDSFLKVWMSALFNLLVRMLCGVRLRDINCGFKLMNRAVMEELLLTGGRFRFVPLMAHWWGFRVGEVPVTHQPRKHGRSSFGGNRFPGALIDLAAMACLIRYHSRPGHLFIQAGAMSGLVGFGICGVIAWLRFSEGTIGYRYPLLALGVLLLIIGVQLAACGFLAEWLAYQMRRAEPGYRVLSSSGGGQGRDAASSRQGSAQPTSSAKPGRGEGASSGRGGDRSSGRARQRNQKGRGPGGRDSRSGGGQRSGESGAEPKSKAKGPAQSTESEVSKGSGGGSSRSGGGGRGRRPRRRKPRGGGEES